jgi:hypothetical protein
MARNKLILADEKSVAEQFMPDDLTWEDQDATYIPGYSEAVKANDLSMSRTVSNKEKERYYKRWGTGPRKLPFEFVYLRMTNAAGGASHSAAIDRMAYQQAGYKICTKDDYLALQDQYPEILKGTPWEAGSAILEPDNTIRRLDSALFVVMTDNPRYLAWQRRRAEENARFHAMAPVPSGPGGYSETEEAGQFEGATLERGF